MGANERKSQSEALDFDSSEAPISERSVDMGVSRVKCFCPVLGFDPSEAPISERSVDMGEATFGTHAHMSLVRTAKIYQKNTVKAIKRP